MIPLVIIVCAIVVIFIVAVITPEKKSNDIESPHYEYKTLSINVGDDKPTKSETTNPKKKTIYEKQDIHFEQLHRKDNRPNNMNCDTYTFSGKYTQTGRIRSNNLLYVFPGEDIINKIKEFGYEEPINYEYKEWEPLTEKQKAVLYDRTNGHYQENLSLIDASCLITQILDGEERASVEFFKYVDSMKIPTSYYQVEKDLINTVYYELDGKDLLTFYIYNVYCRIIRQRIGNLFDSKYKDVFFRFGQENNNEEYVGIIKSRLDHCLVSSHAKWKDAKAFLIEQGILQE